MTPPDPTFDDCFARLAAGDQGAARQIYERFVGQLVQLAARKLDRRLGAQADPESVALSAFESFFAGNRVGKFELHNWGMVFGLLSHITFRKCLNRNRAGGRVKRGGGEAFESFEEWKKGVPDPGPAETVEVTELLAHVLGQFDADERKILDAFLAGASTDDAARAVGLSARTVQRVIDRFRTRLTALLVEA